MKEKEKEVRSAVTVQNRLERIIVGVPKTQLLGSALKFLYMADIPVVGTSDNIAEVIRFDRFTCPRIRPSTPVEFAASLTVVYHDPAMISLSVGAKVFDFGIVDPESASLRNSGFKIADLNFQRVDGSALPAVLISAELVRDDMLKVLRLKGIEGFRDRIAVKLYKAAERLNLRRGELQGRRKALSAYMELLASRPY